MKNYFSQSGFTLIETLVAIAILMVAIAGPLNIAEKGLVAAVDSRDQMIASYLAQDMMEYVKNVRDDNVLASRTWLDNLSGCTTSSPCIAETASDDPNLPSTIQNESACTFTGTPVVLSSSCQLRLDTTDTVGGYYTYKTGSNNPTTQFYRSFAITYLTPDDNTALLTVSVYWVNGTILNKVVLQSVIFNTHR